MLLNGVQLYDEFEKSPEWALEVCVRHLVVIGKEWYCVVRRWRQCVVSTEESGTICVEVGAGSVDM